MYFFFFFSSRRRHTRLVSDWSSDVCSSDLDQVQQALTQMGFSPRKAAVYIEMFQAINAGVLTPQEPRSPQNSTPTSFEEFVQDVFAAAYRSEEHTSELQSLTNLVCRLLLEKKKKSTVCKRIITSRTNPLPHNTERHP